MRYVALLVVMVLFGCKSARPVVGEAAASERLDAAKISAMHQASAPEFSTLYIRASAQYEDDNQAQQVTAEIRMRKDQTILVSVRFLGITMAKALITPDQVRYYEKIGGTYFEGDYQMLSRWLGTELNFEKVQRLLTGRAIADFSGRLFSSSISGDHYLVEASSSGQILKFFFEAGNFLLKEQQLSQPAQNRRLEVRYPTYNDFGGVFLPAQLQIDAHHPEGQTKIGIRYQSVELNQEMSFPYSVPSGYEKINID